MKHDFQLQNWQAWQGVIQGYVIKIHISDDFTPSPHATHLLKKRRRDTLGRVVPSSYGARLDPFIAPHHLL